MFLEKLLAELREFVPALARINKLGRPLYVVFQKENQARLAQICRVAVLEFSNGEAIGIGGPVRHVPISPCEDSRVNVAARNVRQSAVERTAFIFNSNRLMSRASKAAHEVRPIVLQVF